MYWDAADVTNLLLLIPEKQKNWEEKDSRVRDLAETVRVLKDSAGGTSVFVGGSGEVLFKSSRKNALEDAQKELLRTTADRDALKTELDELKRQQKHKHGPNKKVG